MFLSHGGQFTLSTPFMIKPNYLAFLPTNAAPQFHSKSYKSMTRRNNYTVEVKPGSGSPSPCYGHILFYIKINLQCPNPSVCDDKCKCKKTTLLCHDKFSET